MTIRDLTAGEKAIIQDRQLCPFCGRLTSNFVTRARGGLSSNMYCPCGAGFNLASFQGKLILAELLAEPTGPIVWQVDYAMGRGYVCGECFRDGKGKHDDIVWSASSPPENPPAGGTKCDGCEKVLVKERWCECEHPESYHEDGGRCRAPQGSSEAELSYDCTCEKFEEAQGDTLENLGVDLL